MNLPKLGFYELTEKLGEGAMGQIYSAYHQKLKINVAIKIPSNIKSNIDLKRFQREAEVMAKLRHPNIVKVYDVGIANNTPFIAMELLSGITLEKMILEGPINKKKAVDIAIKIAYALGYAHTQKIIHRDIKPDNIMIIKDSEPKIMDFGLAKFCNANVKLSKTGHVAGTIVYSSPEQASGKSNNVDHQSDIYSLGITFYKMLTGRVPYVGDSYMELLYQILKAEPILLTQIKKNIHPNLEAICFKAIAKDKKNRYENAIDFAYDLEMHQKGETPKNIHIKRRIISKNFHSKYLGQATLVILFFFLCFFMHKKWQEMTQQEKAYAQLQQDYKNITNKLEEHHKQRPEYVSLQQNYKKMESEFAKYKENQKLITKKLEETQQKLNLYENPNPHISEQQHYVDLILKKNPVLILSDEEILYKIGKKLAPKLSEDNFKLLDYIYSLAIEVALRKLNIKKNMSMQDFTKRLSDDELELLRKFKQKKLSDLLKFKDTDEVEEQYLQEPLENIYFVLAKTNQILNKEKASACYFNAYNIAAVKNAVVNTNYSKIEKKDQQWQRKHRKKLHGDLNEKDLEEILSFYRTLEKTTKLEEIYLNTAKAIDNYLNDYSKEKNDH